MHKKIQNCFFPYGSHVNPFRKQEIHFLKKKFKIFRTTGRVCKTIVLVKKLAKFQSILYKILCSFKRWQNPNSYKVLVFKIWLFKNQLPDGPSNGLCFRKGLIKQVLFETNFVIFLEQSKIRFYFFLLLISTNCF